MKTRLIFIVIIFVILLMGGLIAWHIFDVSEYARIAVLDYLHQQVSSSLEIQRISFGFGGIKANDVELKLSPRLTLAFAEVRVKIPLTKLLYAGIKKTGNVEEIDFISPVFNITRADSAGTPEKGFQFKPYPLKSLTALRLVKRINVENARISIGDAELTLIDSLSGSANLTDISDVNLSMTGILRQIPEAHVEVDGTLNLTEGSFLLACQAIVKDLSVWEAPDKFNDLKLLAGNALIQVEARGAEDLRISGLIEADSISADYGEWLHLTDGAFHGDLFGSEFGARGFVRANGILLPFVVNVSDIVTPVWQIEIGTDDANLAELDTSIIEIPKIEGHAKVDVRLWGEHESLFGRFKVSAGDVIINRIKIDQLEADAGLDTSGLNIDNIRASIFGGEFELTGFHKRDSSTIDVIFTREWTQEDPSSVFAEDSMKMSISGRFLRYGGLWQGSGSGELVGTDSVAMVISLINLKDSDLRVNVTTPNAEGWMTLRLKLDKKPIEYRIRANDPHQTFNDVIKGKYLPDFLYDYNMQLEINGQKDRFDAELSCRSLSDERQGHYHCNVQGEKSIWTSKGDLWLQLGNGSQIEGRIIGGYKDGNLKLKEIYLNDDDGNKLLSGGFEYKFADGYIRRAFAEADSLPVAQLMRYFIPKLNNKFNGWLNAELQSDKDTLIWRSRMSMDYADSLVLTGEYDGKYAAGCLSFDRFAIINMQEESIIFTIAGLVDLREKNLDSVVVRAMDFPIECALEPILTELSGKIGGRLNARLELDGPFINPEITSDVHLSGGVIQGYSGYWMNMRSLAQDSLYLLDQFDFGKDVSKLLNVSGYINRYDGSQSFRLDGSDVEIGYLIEAITGRTSPLCGESDISVDFSSDTALQQMQMVLEISQGKIKPFNFNGLYASLRVTGLNENKPILKLDTLTVDLGESWCELTGDVVLEKDGEVDIEGKVTGNPLSLLPRVSKFFSDPKGSGEITAQIGGDIANPRLVGGNVKLKNGSIRLDRVVGRIDDLNLGIELDETGKIHFLQFEGSANECPFSIGNRPPELSEEAIIAGGYDFGIIQFKTDSKGIFAVIPRLMRNNWGGYLWFTGFDEKGDFEFHGPIENPSGSGEVRFKQATVTFPFLRYEGQTSEFTNDLFELLRRIKWDARAIPYQGCRYKREISGFPGLPTIRDQFGNELLDVDIKMYVELFIDDNPEGLHFTGSVADTLHISGELTSSSGTLEYLDLKFDVDRLGAIFNPVELEPIFYGGVRTEIIDTTGIRREIRMVIRRTGQDYSQMSIESVPSSGDRGRWGEISFVLEDDQGHSQEQIMAMLGFTSEALPGKLVGIGSRLITDFTPLRRWTASFERQMERWFGVDRVDIEATVARNYLQRKMTEREKFGTIDTSGYSYLSILDYSRVMVGKYVTNDIYVSYTGSLLSETDIYQETRLGVVHDWELIFRLHRIIPNLTLGYRYEYDGLYRVEDNMVSLRYFYIFK